MASLNKLILVPDLEQLHEIFAHRTLSLWRRDEPLSTRWFLAKEQGAPPLELWVDYDDVVFKFECFGFMLRALDALAQDRWMKASLVSEMHEVEFVYRAEWRRPAVPGEVPAHYAQTIRHIGQISDIPDNATDACVSLIGFIWSPIPGKTEGYEALYHDTDETLTVPIYTKSTEVMERLRRTGTSVRLDGLAAWYEKLNAWKDA